VAKGWLEKVIGTFKKPQQSALERAGFHIDKADNFTLRMKSFEPFYKEWERLQIYESELVAGEKVVERTETGTVVEIDFPELLRRERRFIHSAHAFLQSVAIPYFRAMENDVMSRKLVAWTDIYVDYKMRESRYTVADEMRPGCPLRNIRLQAIGGLFKCLGFSFSTEDITAKDVFIIPGLPVEGGVTVRTGQKEEPD